MQFYAQMQIISRPKLQGGGEHWGVSLGDGRVAHCVPDFGVVVTTRQDFEQGRPVRVVRNVLASEWHRVHIRLQQALQSPRPYHATIWNCEIFANWLTGEKPDSPQVTGWFVVAGIAAAVAVAI